MIDTPGNESVRAAASRFFPGEKAEPVAGRPWLLVVSTPNGRASVRQLDPRIPALRVDLVHEFLTQPVLAHATRLIDQDRAGAQAYDARVWAEGTTNGLCIVETDWTTLHLANDTPIDALGSIASSLAGFHRSGLNGSILARAPHFKVKDAITIARRVLEHGEKRLANEIRKESRARRWLTSARPLLSNAEQSIEQAGFLRDEALVIAHLDLWGSHIVTHDSGDATFLDCTRLGAAPAVVDIAQLIARGGMWADERTERVLQSYADVLPLPPLQRRILPWLVALDAIPAAGNVLVRAHDERHPMSDRDRRTALTAADLQLELLAALATSFVPPPPRQRRPGRRSASAGR